ncbi:shikimate dehydrogenase [Clostridium intestinale]|uniref:shikimate dehydrogenase n=1 Tax=Clostridium intestinale TaxID=36845 RepID=UPI002DD6AEF0|nr:shikimate dehydrogenase [Clostridium intestinale]WRY51671.1 shikimate dehydrogenase [Clostridium intestinale]
MLLYGLLGEKLTHSLSPEIHDVIFKNLNLKARYSLFQVEKENVCKVIDSLKVLGISGINVTIPYKEEIIKYLDEISEEAKNIGAVNTVVIKDNKSYGYNTDYFGFGNMLKREDVAVEGKTVVVLGAGGAAKAIIQYFKDNKAKEIYLVSRSKENVCKKYSGVTALDYEELKEISGDIIVNTTPLGMYPGIEGMPVSGEIIMKYKVAVDVIYNPLKTRFLLTAESQGLKAINGLYMLIDQAIKSEEIWHNTTIDGKIGEEIYEDLCKLF